MRLELTKRGDYAVRAMLALARGEGNGPLSVRRIAEEMSIPVRFLPQVMSDLHRAGLVAASSGRSGGYRLARAAASVSLLDVIEAVEGETRRRSCVLRGGPCGHGGQCAVHEVFFAGQEAFLDVFASATLATLREEPRRWIDDADGARHHARAGPSRTSAARAAGPASTVTSASAKPPAASGAKVALVRRIVHHPEEMIRG